MKIQTVHLSDIQYKKVSYEPSLYESIQRIGLSFPLKVIQDQEGNLHCMDGHKRCSVLFDMLRKTPDSRRKEIPIVIVNIARTNSGTTMNHH